MASLNRVFIMGNLGQDPELRYTANQTAVVTLNVATTDNWTGRDGQRQEQTEWHRVIVWGKQAENCGKYLAKGRAVFIEGRLQTRAWEDKNGQKRYTTEINANTVQFMPSSGASGGQGAGRGDFQPPVGDSFGGPDSYGAPGGGSGGSFSGGGNSFGGGQNNFPQAEPAHQGSYGGASKSAPDLDDIPFMRLDEYGM